MTHPKAKEKKTIKPGDFVGITNGQRQPTDGYVEAVAEGGDLIRIDGVWHSRSTCFWLPSPEDIPHEMALRRLRHLSIKRSKNCASPGGVS